MPGKLVVPPTWADDELEYQRRAAIARFVDERKASANEPYRLAFLDRVPFVEWYFEVTNDLVDLASAPESASPEGVLAGRYLAAPIISADDLNTLTSSTVGHRKRVPAELANRATEVILAFADQIRFPWLFESPRRQPTATERRRAIMWTAGLLAARDVSTGRRGESAKRQERAVADLLIEAEFIQVGPRTITLVGDLEPGTFCREAPVIGQKCDIPVRLRDGRLLLIECKVSNSGTNSVKRLVREVGGKAPDWRDNLGKAQCFTAAVLAGVYTMKSLKTARDEKGVLIFWEHDLEPLRSFVKSAE